MNKPRNKTEDNFKKIDSYPKDIKWELRGRAGLVPFEVGGEMYMMEVVSLKSQMFLDVLTLQQTIMTPMQR